MTERALRVEVEIVRVGDHWHGSARTLYQGREIGCHRSPCHNDPDVLRVHSAKCSEELVATFAARGIRCEVVDVSPKLN